MLRVALKDLAQRKLRLVATSLAVLLGVAFMSGTLVLTDTVGRAFDDIFSSAFRGTDAFVRSDRVLRGADRQQVRGKLPESIIRTVSQVDGVAVAAGGVQDYAQLVRPNGEVLGNPRQGAPTFGANWIDDPALSGFHVVEGRAPVADGEVVIDRASADRGPFHVGDTVQLLLRSGTTHVKVVGIAKFGAANGTGGATWALFSLPTAQRLLDSVGRVDYVQVRAKPGVSQEELVRRIRQKVPDHTEVLTGKKITKELQDQIRQGLGFFTTFLLIFGLVALVVGAFIIANTFSIIVSQRTRELALFRALGASRRQVLASVVIEAVTIGLIAALVGLVGGILLALSLQALLTAFGFGLPTTGIVVAPRTIVAALGVGVVVTVVSALVPAWRASGVPPLAAMRDVAIDRSGTSRWRAIVGLALVALGIGGVVWGTVRASTITVGVGGGVWLLGVVVAGPLLARTVGSVIGLPASALRGLTGRIARENTQRNPRRTAGSAAALMIGVIIVTIISVIASSATATVDSTINTSFKGDFVVQSTGLGVPLQVVTDLRRRPQIGAVVSFVASPIKIGSEAAYIDATDTEHVTSLVDLKPRQGSIASLGPDGIAVSNKKSGFGGPFDAGGTYRIGDTVRVSFLDGAVVPFKVKALYGDPTLVGRFLIDNSALGNHVANPVSAIVLIDRAPGASLADARRAATEVAKSYPSVVVQNSKEYSSSVASQVRGILNFIYVLLLLAIVIALIGIANTLSLSIAERTRELGLLRAVGMYRAQVRSTVRWESVIVAVLGTVTGMVIGLAVGAALVRTLHDSGLRVLAVPTGTLVVVLVLSLLAGLLAAVFPARRAARLDILKAIGTE